jgi:hypothetical protein
MRNPAHRQPIHNNEIKTPDGANSKSAATDDNAQVDRKIVLKMIIFIAFLQSGLI